MKESKLKRRIVYESKLKYTLGFYGIKFFNHIPKDQRFMRSLSFKIQINKIDKETKRVKNKFKFPF